MGTEQEQRLTRRHMMLAGLSTLVLGGCASSGSRYAGRPTAPWPGYPAGPTQRGVYTPVKPPYTQPTQPGVVTPPVVAAGGISALARSQWASAGPNKSKVNAMNGITKITVHHEGSKTVDFTDTATTKARIESIRSTHVRDRGWGDIGYHYIVDRAGRVWEGRPIAYQGAHVSENNENNVGILVLGNFAKQAPTQAQLDALFKTTADLKRVYRVKTAMVRSHQEIKATECPGSNLQKKMDALRRHVG